MKRLITLGLLALTFALVTEVLAQPGGGGRRRGGGGGSRAGARCRRRGAAGPGLRAGSEARGPRRNPLGCGWMRIGV